MIEFKNHLTGTLMAVAPEREAEYLAAGHIRVNGPEPESKVLTVEHTPATTPAAAPVKHPAVKSAAKSSGSASKKKSPAAKK